MPGRLILILCAALLLASTAASAERRIALVIGNSEYREAPLRNPVNDARAIAAKLKRMGFEVQAYDNLTQKQMTRAITRFGETLAQGGGIGLFFFAGHGMQVRGRNFLVPVDAQIGSEASVRSEAVDMDIVLEQLGGGDQGLNIVILDACRNNPFERRFRSGGNGLAQMEAPKGTLIAYATAPGKVAADGEGANGLYTAELLKVIEAPGIKIEDVFKRVRANVAKATQDQQLPWESSSLTGDFYFVPKGATVTINSPGAANKAAAEDRVWAGIKDSGSAKDFETFLAAYPDSVLAPFARNRLDALRAAPPAAPAARPPAAGGIDYAALPFLSERWRAQLASIYPELKRPKALAIAANGRFSHYSFKSVERSEAETVRNTLEGCEALARRPCVLYAINDVPTGDMAPRPQKFPRSGAFRLDEVPFVAEQLKARSLVRYAEGGGSRALALSPRGHWGYALNRASVEEAKRDALETCRKNDAVDCFVYAVDDRVVWER